MSDNKKAVPPWGTWLVLEDSHDFKVKRIDVLPGKRLSYQKHLKREEHWYVVKGKARVTIEGKEHRLDEGQAIDIGKNLFHRIENVGDDMLTFIEVQRGEYFGEDDILRIEDDFGRA